MVLDDILAIRSTLHGAGTVSAEALRAIAKHAGTRTIRHSVETGCGATTLLLSHLSESHTVFALDMGGSVTNVRQSGLLRKEVVQFVEGPSQITLPQHRFTGKVQLALIDGAHAYPFPDLEYYFLYPHLDCGALLILDDIQIRSIHKLFDFLRHDEMFQLDEVVRNTAFFTRTNAPTFDPCGDGWEQQGYNRRTLLRYDWRSKVASSLPRSMAGLKSRGRLKPAPHCSVEINSPAARSQVSDTGIVEGRATMPECAQLWVLVHRKDIGGWWPQGGGAIPVVDGAWSVQVNYGEPHDAGYKFEIVAMLVRGGTVGKPNADAVLAESYRTVVKR